MTLQNVKGNAHPIPPKVKAALASALADYRASQNKEASPGPEWVELQALRSEWHLGDAQTRRIVKRMIKAGALERVTRGRKAFFRVKP